MSAPERNVVGRPYFEDFEVGQIFDDAPSFTLTSGHAAVHQALVGDRLRLPLDTALSAAVTRHDQPLAHPNLVCDVAIGQSTGPSQRVRGNLFYRGLVLLRPVFIGDTLRTRTEVVGLKQNRAGSGSGLVALRIRTANQHGEPVLDFWRCPMIPMHDVDLATGHRDRFENIPEELDLAPIAASVPSHWCLDAFRARLPGPHAGDLAPGAVYVIVGRDTVTSAPELARLPLNRHDPHRRKCQRSRPTPRLRRPHHRDRRRPVHASGPEPGHDPRVAELRAHRRRLRWGRAVDRAHGSRSLHRG